MKLLCLSTDVSLSQEISSHASRLNWSAVVVNDRQHIREAVDQHHPDVVLVEVSNLADLNWWKGSGHEFKAPVIFMNSEMTEEFYFSALESGADAFLPKPLFSIRHFEARIRASLRKNSATTGRRFVPRLNLTIDSERYTIEVGGRALNLTLTEFKILRQLGSEETKVVSRQDIQTQVFGQSKLSTRSLDVHICALRKKIKPVGLTIESVRGVGYRLNPCRE